MCGEPRVRRTAHAALLLAGDGLDGVAVARASLLLHLDEAQRPPATHDQVDLVTGRPDVRAEDAPAPQAIPARGPPFGPVHLLVAERLEAQAVHGGRPPLPDDGGVPGRDVADV